jgi:hypothetical protein
MREGRSGGAAVGSDAHKELFCRMLLDTFDPYRPAVIAWPALEGEALERLTGLPFWDIAVTTEGETAMRMQAMAEATRDPLLREAIALNAFEERRHKEVLEHMIRFYGIPLAPEPAYARPADPERAFVETGYGECFDSFFAFGLFKLARDSGFFPPALVEVFEPVIQEEARHNLFFANWIAYAQARRPPWRRPAFAGRRLAALAGRAWNRLSFAGEQRNNSRMTIKGHESMGIRLSPRSFIEICLAENERRLGRYDGRLLRPRVLPWLAGALRPLLGRA